VLHEEHGVVCAACGVQDLEATKALADAQERIRGLENELAAKRSQITRLRGDQDSQQRGSPFYEAAMRVLEKWRELCMPTARELEGERLKITLARFNGGEIEERLMKCVEGYSRYPYTVNARRVRTGPKDAWYADISTIFRNAGRVDKGIRLAELDELHAAAFQPTTPSRLGRIGQAAMRYVELGWKVFPCRAGAKQPATTHGLLDATGDLDRVAAYWARVPDANVAIRTGQESGIIVIDIDSDTGGFDSLAALEAAKGSLPTTASVVTPRGGQHFYFRHPGHEIRNTAGIVAPGIDIRGDGGYVLAPPSLVAGKGYEPDQQVPLAELPDWLVRGLLEYQARTVSKLARGDYAQLLGECVNEGQRHQTLTQIVGHEIAVKGADRADEVYAWMLVLNRQNVRPPVSERELEKIVTDIAKREVRKPLREAA
jgi:hypothetical protein